MSYLIFFKQIKCKLSNVIIHNLMQTINDFIIFWMFDLDSSVRAKNCVFVITYGWYHTLIIFNHLGVTSMFFNHTWLHGMSHPCKYVMGKVGNRALLCNARTLFTIPKHFGQCKNDHFNIQFFLTKMVNI